MPIVFSAVACDRNIVADFASCDGNFTEIAEQVLSKLPLCNNKMTYSHGIYLLHYIAKDDYLYFCITDKLCQRSRAFLFLNEIERRFISSKQIEDFTTILAAEMYRYSEDYSTIEIRKGELDEINSIGVGCSETILGEKILYITNPDIISYSIISNVSVTPGIISVLAESSISEGISEISPTIGEVLVEHPTQDTISVKTPTPERPSSKTSTPERALIKTPTPERTLVKTQSPERLLVKTPPPQQTTVKTETPELTLAKPLIPERTSPKTPTPERKSVVNLTLERPSDKEPTPEDAAIDVPTLNRTLVRNLNSEELLEEHVTPETILIGMNQDEESVGSPVSKYMTSTVLDRIPADSPNSPDFTSNMETISSVTPAAERISDMSPRLYYVVIIGMIILVISMLIYAFGPISCVIVTGVGMFSLFKSYVDPKDKLD